MRQPTDGKPREREEQKLLEELMARCRRSPGEFRTAASLAASAGLDPGTLDRVFRVHGHRTAEGFLQEARVDMACGLLLDHFGPPEAAGEACGFPGHGEFQAQFHRRTGLTPARYQALGREGAAFTLDLPGDYRAQDVLAYHGRDPLSLSERVDGPVLLKGLKVEGRDALVEMAFKPRAVRVRVKAGPEAGPAFMGRVHARVARMLGLGSDPAPFERSLEGDGRFRTLVALRSGLRIPLTADVWEALVWAILGQQVNLAFAYTLRRRLTELCGGEAGGLWTHPGPAEVARLDPAELAGLQFSRNKAEYLVHAAREVASGELALERLPAGPASSAEAALARRRGIGPWTAHYVMMRGCGFGDCVPLGDAGLTAALQRHFELDHRPDARETAALMAPFAPYRSLATFHLWASLKGVPA